MPNSYFCSYFSVDANVFVISGVHSFYMLGHRPYVDSPFIYQYCDNRQIYTLAYCGNGQQVQLVVLIDPYIIMDKFTVHCLFYRAHCLRKLPSGGFTLPKPKTELATSQTYITLPQELNLHGFLKIAIES